MCIRDRYGIVGLSTLILLVYALPAVWALFHFAKKWKLSWVPVLFSLLGGGFVAGDVYKRQEFCKAVDDFDRCFAATGAEKGSECVKVDLSAEDEDMLLL